MKTGVHKNGLNQTSLDKVKLDSTSEGRFNLTKFIVTPLIMKHTRGKQLKNGHKWTDWEYEADVKISIKKKLQISRDTKQP